MQKISYLKNSKFFTGLVFYRYYKETWKREKSHSIDPITDKAILDFKNDMIMYEAEKKRWYKTWVKPYRPESTREFRRQWKHVNGFPYEKLVRIYRFSHHVSLYPF